MNAIAELKKIADGVNVRIKDCGNGHIQIEGLMLVNWWPESKKRTAHVGATRKGFTGVSAQRAIELAMQPPLIVEVKDERRSTYRDVKTKMFRKQKTCNWCHVQLTLDGEIPGTMKATLDHVIPLKRGGLDNANNWVLACEPCNSKRGHDMSELKQPTEDDVESLLQEQKKLTAIWYEKMSGQRPWKDGERKVIDSKFESQNKDIHSLLQQIAALEFASLEAL